jgi:hypothetical protein
MPGGGVFIVGRVLRIGIVGVRGVFLDLLLVGALGFMIDVRFERTICS